MRREQESNISVSQALTTDRQHKHDISLADNLQIESVLVSYLKKMTDLFNKNNFTFSKSVRVSIIRPKTLSALWQLDPARKTQLIQFLYESELITTSTKSVELEWCGFAWH
ncbi:unnamed protein product [Rotaria socialis]|uniref:Uncharacterized protein n=1 Tax=Rotaria socialis TaxID=392032 RepID=A0A818DJ83_9BILA|nr:unnamed protein product [Rotaria socialis]CAF3348632.1 unnamed protein product [Rotaria socialis]CAF3443311.1 unnamed protein product [Rotaria socialis]CAF3556733.1 unnamed protein product [Rotaria socialis]CAF4573639.1 unnamed protein product [Rotaria socialis]